MEGANLECANLEWADLKGANLHGAYLEWANLSGANVTDGGGCAALGPAHGIGPSDYRRGHRRPG